VLIANERKDRTSSTGSESKARHQHSCFHARQHSKLELRFARGAAASDSMHSSTEGVPGVALGEWAELSGRRCLWKDRKRGAADEREHVAIRRVRS
jgi:hypothetical protein